MFTSSVQMAMVATPLAAAAGGADGGSLAAAAADGSAAAVAAPAAAGAAAGEAARPQESISVIARVRPSEYPSPNLHIRENLLEIQVPRGDELIHNQIEEYKFPFSRVIPPEANQSQVFGIVAQPLVMGALEGVNCSIFAYGQTGSGKTHTICGGKGSYNERGIIPRTMCFLFDEIERRQDGVNYSISISMIEVYMEIGYDLLAKNFDSNLKNSPKVTVSLLSGEPVLSGAQRITIASEDEGLHQYYVGDTHRTVAETAHNAQSSRSHCIFSIFIEASDPVAQRVRTSKIQIVDLAGSERLKPYEQGSQSKKSLMDQAIAINMSLHFLAVVINALTSNIQPVPYRNSFLTKVLKDALGGNARAAMVCTVNPSDAAMPETVSSCRFAMRVANVQTFARINEELDPQLVIASLKKENAELKSALAAAEGREDVEELMPDELRRRARAFLEDESGGADAASNLNVGSWRDVFAAFRVLREMYWELLVSKRGSGGKRAPLAADDPKHQGDSLAGNSGSGEGSSSPAATSDAEGLLGAEDSPGDGETVAMLRAKLAEQDRECRGLRAMLAAMPKAAARPAKPAPVARPVSASDYTQTDASQPKPAAAKTGRPKYTISTGSQTEALPAPKPRKPKRLPSGDNRPKGMRITIGFSPEDIVDRFGGQDGGRVPAVAPKITDSRVPDFRTLRRDSPLANAGRSVMAPRSPIPGGEGFQPQMHSPPPASATPHRTLEAAQKSATPSFSPALVAELEAPAPPPVAAPSAPGGASSAWLCATTALNEDEREVLGDPAEAYQVFLENDPRAADIWPAELQNLRTQRRDRMEEARTLGQDIESTKQATAKVQTTLETLRGKLRDAEAAAAVDPSASQKAQTLRTLLAGEEPKLVQLFDEKRQRYELDFGRLKELKRELTHLGHEEKKLESLIQREFAIWRTAVEERYPGVVVAFGAQLPTIRVAQAEEEEEEDADEPERLATAASRPTSTRPPTGGGGGAASTGRPPTAGSRPIAAESSVSVRSSVHSASPVRAAPAPARASSPARAQSPARAATPVRSSPAARAAPSPQAHAPQPPEALVKAEAALSSLRVRLEEARASGDERRVQMLGQLLAAEEPRIQRLRAEHGL